LAARVASPGLSAAEVSCLKAKAAASSSPDAAAASRALIDHYRSTGDAGASLSQIQAHLEGLDPNDAELAYAYGLHLYKAGDLAGAKRWAEAAFANRSSWTGAAYASRTAAVYKLLAAIQQASWQRAEEAAKAGGDSERAAADRAKQETARLAREWLGFVEGKGLPADEARALCRSAGGDC
jgi:hypothetical protein